MKGLRSGIHVDRYAVPRDDEFILGLNHEITRPVSFHSSAVIVRPEPGYVFVLNTKLHCFEPLFIHPERPGIGARLLSVFKPLL